MRKLNPGRLRAPSRLSVLATAAAFALCALAPSAGAATRLSPDSRIVDLGVAPATDVKTLTIALALRNQAALDTLLAGLSDAKSANFRKFITPAQFAADYGQTAATVAQVTSYLQAQGFTIKNVHANNLLITVSATNAQIAATFGTSIHNYALNGVGYQAPASAAVMPAQFSGVLSGVAGLSTRKVLQSKRVRAPNLGALAGDVPAATVAAWPSASANATPGAYTVLDLAAKYNINPLYAKGLTGAGRTIGIVTLAGYNQSDAYAYWNALGLAISPTRITDVLVDGGALPEDGPGSEGAGETTLDVEQSGGLAPGANVRVYVAPNTDNGFIDVFAAAVDENLVDTLSVSWGSPELFYLFGATAELQAFHAVFEQAAAQGIPVIAAAGDAGAFDINRSYPYPYGSTLLTVDFPAADPLVLAAGGTTLPNSVQHKYGPVTVTTERPWGWDYLQSYILAHYSASLYYLDYYQVGGGGGVSVFYPLPSYQAGLTGVMTSASAQSWFVGPVITGAGWEDWADLPAGYAGRNLPDVSLNADPYSGYGVLVDGAYSTFSGGTSFVSPQLNGILTLIASGLPGRVGQINPQLYAAFKTQGYATGSPFKAITTGDNEYYKAAAHYNPASGLGSLDVSALATTLGVK